MSEDFLFVYGKLRQRSDREIALLFLQNARILGPARVNGQLYNVGGYPGAILSDDPQDQVLGQLLALPDEEALWRILDDYEGIGPIFSAPFEYERCRVPVQLEDGSRFQAWMFLYRHDLAEARRIDHGDYLKYLQSEMQKNVG
nr:gamma-glutamylcyclotransferase family protein [uncultured Cohaesibacter sp.]